MLVLTRKPEEKIQIGDNVVITVLRVKGKGVSIGIEAPRDMQVLRGELTEFKTAVEPTTHRTFETPERKVRDMTAESSQNWSLSLPSNAARGASMREMLDRRAKSPVANTR